MGPFLKRSGPFDACLGCEFFSGGEAGFVRNQRLIDQWEVRGSACGKPAEYLCVLQGAYQSFPLPAVNTVQSG